MKKKLSLFFAVVALLLTGQTAVAQTFVVDNLSFTVTDADAKTVSVSKTDGISGNVVIPASVTNEGVTYAVTSVPNLAFYYCSAITGITIPASVASVGNQAFQATALTSITIEDSETALVWSGGTYHPLYNLSTSYELYLGRDLTVDGDRSYFPGATSVVIGDKVTAINNYLFQGASKLATVTMGSGVTTIGDYAFQSTGTNESVTEQTITLGPNVTTIGTYAFYGCSHLSAIDLGSKLTAIPNLAFYNCSALTSITIPASVASVGNQAFQATALTSITIEDSETALVWSGGGYHPLYNLSTSYELNLGRNLTTEGDRSYFPGATSVVIGDKVTAINNNLFQNASKLATVTMGSGVTTIGDYAFQSTGTNESVTEQTITLGPNVTTIGTNAFYGCSHLSAIDLGSKLTAIPNLAFYNCSALTSITIPASVASVGNQAFQGTALTSITIEDSETALVWSGGYYHPLFNLSTSYELYLGRDLTVDTDGSYFPGATSVVIGDKVTAINNKLFQGASKLATVKMGSGVTTIGDYAFQSSGRDESVTEQTITLGPNVTTIGTNAFDGCNHLTAIDLGSKLTAIPDKAFNNCSVLTSITIPASVASVGSYAFYNTALTSITIEDSETALVWSGGYYHPLYNLSTSYELYLGRDLTPDTDGSYFPGATSVVIGDKVTAINNKLFQGASKLATVTMGSGVTTIGDYAFQSSGRDESVTEQTITLGPNVTTIGTNAFDGCNHLTAIDLGSKLTAIPNNAFYGCSVLTSITIPASVASVGSQAFYNTALTSITIEDSETALAWNGGYYHPLYNLGTNYELYLGRDLALEYDSNCFPKATKLTLGEKVTNINNLRFYEQNVLTDVEALWTAAPLMALGDGDFHANTFANATLWVPGGTKNLYQDADGWKKFEKMDFASFVVTTSLMGKGTLDWTNGEEVAGNGMNTPLSLTGTKLVSEGAGDAVSGLFVREKDLTFTATPASGYELTGFTANGTAKEVTAGNAPSDVVISNLLEDQTVLATFTPIIYTITYSNLLDGALPDGKSNPATYTVEDNAITLVNPVRTGYNFKGWTGTGLESATMTVVIPVSSTGNREYTATWEPIVYTLTYDLAGGALADGESNPATYTIESDAITLVNPTRKGYDFAGWTGTGLTEATMTVTIAKGSIDNRSYKATWTPVTYAISYDLAGGALADGESNPATYTIESDAITLVNPTRKGYDFAGWTGTGLTEATMTVTIAKGSTENRSYKATWTPITYTISYDLDGGALAGGESNPATYTIESDAITLVNPTRKGYNFAGWTGTGLSEPTKTVTIAKGSTENRSYTATWTVITYTISYDLAGGTVATANPEEYTIETTTFTLNNPTREGYSFDGWTGTDFTEPTKTLTIAKGSTGDRSYTANWTRNAFTLSDTDSESTNASLLSAWNGKVADVTLSGRTLNKNNEWNTICLPFDLTIAGSVLDGAEVRTLASTTLAGQNLSMTFSGNLTEMEAGKPYVIRWASGEPLVNPTFEGVTVKNANVKTNSITTDYVTFTGTYTPTALTKDDVSNLYLGSNNTLYYPNVDGFKVNAFRGFFKVDDSATAMGLNIITDLGDGSTTRIQGLEKAGSELDSWFTLNGMKLDSKPTQKGVYIHNGTKVVIK